MIAVTQPEISRRTPVGAVLLGTAAFAAAFGYAITVLSPGQLIRITLALAFLAVLALVPQRRRLLVAAVLFAAPLNIDQTFMRRPSSGGADGFIISLTDLLMVVLLIITLARASQLRRSGELRAFPAVTLPSAALLLAALLSVLNARDLLWSGFDLFSLVKTLFFFWLLANNIRSRSDLDAVLLALFAGMILQTIIAAMMTSSPTAVEWMAALKLGIPQTLLESREYYESGYRAGGSIGDANHLARYMSFILPLAAVTALTERRRSMRLAGVAALAVGGYGVAATLTRSAWIGLAFAFLFLVPLLINFRLLTMRVILRLSAMTTAVLIVLVLFHRPLFERLTGDDNGSWRTRITTAKVALDIVRDYPLFGCGINNYGTLFNTYWSSEDVFTRKAAVHNTYLLYAAETGLVGLAAYLWLLAAALVRTWRALKCRLPQYSATAVGLFLAWIAYLVEALTDKSYKECYTLLLTFWALLAVTEALIRLDQSPAERAY